MDETETEFGPPLQLWVDLASRLDYRKGLAAFAVEVEKNATFRVGLIQGFAE